MPVGVYLGFKVLTYHTVLVHVSPHVSPLHLACGLLATLPIWRCYLRCWLGDPGTLTQPAATTATAAQRLDMFAHLVEGVTGWAGNRYTSTSISSVLL